MSKFKRFTAGDPPTFRAPTLNAWQDVAEWYAKNRIDGKGGQSLGVVNTTPSHVSVEASSFTVLGAILTPTGPSANDPATFPLESRRRPCVQAAVPTSDEDSIVVICEPAIHDDTGDPGLAIAVAQGVATVKVLMMDSSHRWARPQAGNSEYLISDDFGPAWLMYPGLAQGTDPTDAEPVNMLVQLIPPQPTVTLRQRRPLDMPCLIPVLDTAGDVVGISGLAQRWVQENGEVHCLTSGVCEGEDCGSLADPDPDITPPPPFEPPTPPDPPPESYMVWVSIQECEGYSPSGFPYTVTVPGSSQGTQSVGSGGAWFSGIPWGTDTSVTVSYGGIDPIMWSVFAFAPCGGSGANAFGATATVNGESCEHMSVAFAIGGCPPFAETDLENVDAPPIDEEEH